MGKPLSRPDCLRRNPSCLGKGEDEEGYIEDCYVPQRSIYDTMRINEQIDQGSKLNQPSHSTLGSGGGEGSTLSSNGTLGAGVVGAASVFESRQPETGRKLDERVIFDALKLTGDSPAKPAPSLAPGSGSGSAASSGLVLGSGAVPGGVPKRRAGGGGGGGKDNVNRRSWKAFMPPNYPEFAERMEVSVGDYPGEKRLSGLMSPVLPHPLTPASLPLTPAPHSTPSSPGDFYSSTPNYTPPQLPQQLQHAQRPPSQHQQHQHLHQHQKQQPILTAQSPLLPPVPARRSGKSIQIPQSLNQPPQAAASDSSTLYKAASKPPAASGRGREQTDGRAAAASKSEETDRGFPFLPAGSADSDGEGGEEGEATPLLSKAKVKPKARVRAPPRATTWPRSLKAAGGGEGGRERLLVPRGEQGEDEEEEEEEEEGEILLLAPPSPFLVGGLPLSPCLSRQGSPGAGGLLGRLQERTASELRFEEDERRILAELEQDEGEGEEGVTDQEAQEERGWAAVLRLEPRSQDNPDFQEFQDFQDNSLEYREWDAAGETDNGQALTSSPIWPLLAPPTGFGCEAEPQSPRSASEAGSEDLFLQLESQCLEEEEEEEEAGEAGPTQPVSPCPSPLLEHLSFAPTGLDEAHEKRVHPEDTAGNRSPASRDCSEGLLPLEGVSASAGELTDCSAEREETQTHPPSDLVVGGCEDPDSDFENTDDPPDPVQGDPFLVLEASKFPNYSPSCTPRNPYSDAGKETDSDFEEEGVGTGGGDPTSLPEGLMEETPKTATAEELDSPKQEVTELEKDDGGEEEEGGGEQVMKQEGAMPRWSQLPASRTPPEGVSQPHRTDSVCPDPPLTPTTLPNQTETETEEGEEGCDGTAFVQTDSFVYLAVSAPQPSPTLPESPSASQCDQSSQQDPPSSPGPKGGLEPECSFQSTDSFVYLAAPERLPCISQDWEDSQERGAGEGLGSWEHRSDSSGSRQDVDFVLGSMSEDSDWESESENSEGSESCSDGWDYWDLLEPGLLRGLFPEVEELGKDSRTLEFRDSLPAGIPDGEERNSAGVSLVQGSALIQEVFQKEQVEPLQPRLQQANGAGQGLIQSAGKNSDTQGLEHELQETNARWNTLNKRVAERITHLQEALLHCGKFQDALEPLLSWLTDTEELIANQRPPSAEYKVVKAQIQEQKLLQRLLDDRRGTVEMIKAEGERIAQSAEPSDQEKIRKQLESLGESWRALLSKADTRQSQLEELLVLAKQFHETTEPLGEWLSATEKKLANSEPVGTQTSKINQQITQHKALSGEISGRSSLVDRAVSLGASLSLLSCPSDRARLSELLQGVQEGYREVRERACRKGALLEQALANARIFGEDEVEVLNWLAEVQDRLEGAAVRDFRQAVLHRDHSIQLTLNEEIVTRRKNMDQAVKNGQALLKQTTGEEVIVIQEKLDGIKTRYADITAASSRALRTLEQALQLSTRFSSTHQELCDWLNGVEEELNQSGGQSPSPEQIPRFHERQKELKNAATEQRLVLDTVNEVSSALLELVPWRAREGLDRLVSEANERFRSVSDIIAQRVQQIDAAIQRSQKYEQAADAELAWVSETERKLSALGPIRLQQDQTTAQIQVQKAFSIDIIRHKDSIDELLATREEILGTCGEEQKAGLQRKTDSLLRQYDAVSQLNLDRYAQLERAQVLVNQFWETHEELLPWLQETQTLLGQLPGPAVNHEALRQQQEEMRQLRESISEHKPHIDKLLKIGPQLEELNPGEGEMVRERYGEAGRCYTEIKEVVKRRATALDEAVSQSTQFHDKIEPMLETLEHLQSRLHQPPAIPAEVDKIREQLGDNKGLGLELEKLQPSFQALCSRGEELLARSQGPDKDPAAKEIRDRLDRLRFCWDDIRARAEEREGKLLDVLDLAEKFWYDMTALLSTIRDTQDIVKELEEPSIDPSLIKQQIEAAQAIKSETDGLREELEFVRILGADLIFACGETEKPEVKKTIDEMNSAWEGLNRTWKERMDQLEEAMAAAVQYQDALQGMFDYLDNAVIRLCDMSPVGTDVSTIKQQIEELKLYKVDVYQQQIDMERLNHQGELMLKKAMDDTDRVITQEPLTELRHLWDNLGEKIIHRQHKLEGALLALGQFQHALSELQSWLTHTTEMLDAQRPISTDPKAIEIELAKHHVLRNDVLSHRSTVDTVNKAGRELQESSAGDEASHLKQRLQRLNSSWEAVLLRTQERQGQLEAALQQAEGFHGEVEDFLQWLRRSESQLAASKPTGGLPETAREQLQQHMELQSQFAAREELYLSLLDKGHRMLLSREDPGAGSNTEQNLTLLEHKWEALRSKMEERKGKLEEALSLATGFQSSLQDFINWLTQAEQILNLAQPPSLLLDTVLFQIDEHKVFVNEVNTHRDQILALDKAGVQLKFSSQKQDVVLIKNLLLSMQGRWEKVVQRSLERGRALDEARKRAKQFHEAWRKLSDWLEEAEKQLNSELEISNDPDKIKLQLSQHKEFQKTLGGKQPVYDTMARSGRSMKEKASQPEDRQRLDNLLGEVRDKWDTVCGKSVERQHKLEEALLFSGQFADALQALVDWLYRVEPQLSEEQPVHGDVDLVSNLLDAHKVFQKELGKRTGSVQALKRSARELIDTARDDTTWVKVQLQELSTRWDSVCSLSVIKQTRLEQALKQAEEFRAAVQQLLEWLSEAEQTLRFRGLLPDERDTLQSLIDLHKEFMKNVEEKRVDVNKAAGMGEEILTVCHPDCITTIKHWITIIRARFEEVMTWAKQHQQRLETALAELVNNAELLDQLLSWLQWAETTLIQRDQEPLPQNIELVKERIAEHQSFMEEMTRKQPDVDKVTKTYKRKTAGPSSLSLAEKSRARKALPHSPSPLQLSAQSELKSPRVTQLSARWQQVWLLALDRQRKLNDALDRLEELKEFANFDFDVWRKKYMRWMNHKKSRVMDFFRRIDRDQDGKITRQEFIDGILASKFPTSKLEMMAVADIFDGDGDGYIDYYEFVAALHPNKDAYRPTTDADKIEDEVTRQVAQCKCAKRFQVEQIGENKYRFFLGNQFGDSQQLRLVRILRSTVMVRVGGGWMALDEFLVKNDPCRARGRTNLELREKFILPEGMSQGMAAFRSRGRKSKPSSRAASPTRSSSSASQSNHSCTSVPSSPATPASGSRVTSGSKLKRPTFHSSRGSLTGENGNQGTPTSAKSNRSESKRGASSVSRPSSRAGSRAGSRASSRRGSDASDFDLLETQSACSDVSETSASGATRRGGKPSKIPTISKKTTSPSSSSSTTSPKTPGNKR